VLWGIPIKQMYTKHTTIYTMIKKNQKNLKEYDKLIMWLNKKL